MQNDMVSPKGLRGCESYHEHIRFRPGVLVFRLHVARFLCLRTSCYLVKCGGSGHGRL